MMSGNPRIVFVLPSLAGGGAERVIVTLAALANRTIFDPSLLVLEGSGELAKDLPANVPLTSLGVSRLRGAASPLIRALRRIQPDIIVSTFPHINTFLLISRPLLGRAKLILREANLPSANVARIPSPILMRAVYRHLYNRAETVIATSQLMRTDLLQHGVSERCIKLLNNPVDEDALRHSAEPLLRRPGPGLRLVAVGRLTPAKDFARLLDILAGMPPDTHCIIFGEGPERTVLENRIRELGISERVELAGFVRNLTPWIAGADALIMTSRFEGMPNAALEALALGTPVVAAPTAGGLVELKSVLLATSNDDFLRILHRLKVGSEGLRSTMLPPDFRMDRVATRFNQILREL